MAVEVFGLTSIHIGDIAGDGGMGTALTEVFGNTVEGTAVLETTEPSTEDIPIEESDAPIKTLTSDPGKWNLVFHSYNLSKDAMIAAFGGTFTGDGSTTPFVWSAPDQRPTVEKSVEVTTKGGVKFSFPRMSLVTKATITFTKTGLGKLEMSGTVLKPNKAGEPILQVEYPL
jgi:hypothetical protein